MLKSPKPLGIREIQRALNLSSPSVVQYHLTKLERAGLIRREMGNFIVNKKTLNFIKINHFLVPKYLFYSLFAFIVLIIELTILKPDIPYQWYFFIVMASIIFLIIFCFETAKVWLKGAL